MPVNAPPATTRSAQPNPTCGTVQEKNAALRHKSRRKSMGHELTPDILGNAGLY